MKYIRVTAPETAGEGDFALLKDGVVCLLDDSPLSGESKETGVRFGIEKVETYLPPFDPPNIIALGLNYAGHARESRMELPKEPVIFMKATTALTGHLGNIVLPLSAPCEVDYEAELTVIIGKRAKNVKEDRALDYVFGYTCGNDVSARDCQMKYDRQWARAKSFDTFAPAGPFAETRIDASDLRLAARLNGRIMQEDSTKNMIFKIPQIISYLSRQMTLLPGTFIMTGTPPGVGYARSPRVFLSPGDVVEVEIERLGILKNTVVMEEDK